VPYEPIAPIGSPDRPRAEMMQDLLQRIVNMRVQAATREIAVQTELKLATRSQQAVNEALQAVGVDLAA